MSRTASAGVGNKKILGVASHGRKRCESQVVKTEMIQSKPKRPCGNDCHISLFSRNWPCRSLNLGGLEIDMVRCQERIGFLRLEVLRSRSACHTLHGLRSAHTFGGSEIFSTNCTTSVTAIGIGTTLMRWEYTANLPEKIRPRKRLLE